MKRKLSALALFLCLILAICPLLSSCGEPADTADSTAAQKVTEPAPDTTEMETAPETEPTPDRPSLEEEISEEYTLDFVYDDGTSYPYTFKVRRPHFVGEGVEAMNKNIDFQAFRSFLWFDGQTTLGEIYDAVKTNTTGKFKSGDYPGFFNFNYEGIGYENLMCVKLMNSIQYFAAGIMMDVYSACYFDLDKKAEITLNEYLEGTGITLEELISMFASTEEGQNYRLTTYTEQDGEYIPNTVTELVPEQIVYVAYDGATWTLMYRVDVDGPTSPFPKTIELSK